MPSVSSSNTGPSPQMPALSVFGRCGPFRRTGTRISQKPRASRRRQKRRRLWGWGKRRRSATRLPVSSPRSMSRLESSHADDFGRRAELRMTGTTGRTGTRAAKADAGVRLAFGLGPEAQRVVRGFLADHQVVTLLGRRLGLGVLTLPMAFQEALSVEGCPLSRCGTDEDTLRPCRQ